MDWKWWGIVNLHFVNCAGNKIHVRKRINWNKIQMHPCSSKKMTEYHNINTTNRESVTLFQEKVFFYYLYETMVAWNIPCNKLNTHISDLFWRNTVTWKPTRTVPRTIQSVTKKYTHFGSHNSHANRDRITVFSSDIVQWC